MPSARCCARNIRSKSALPFLFLARILMYDGGSGLFGLYPTLSIGWENGCASAPSGRFSPCSEAAPSLKLSVSGLLSLRLLPTRRLRNETRFLFQ